MQDQITAVEASLPYTKSHNVISSATFRRLMHITILGSLFVKKYLGVTPYNLRFWETQEKPAFRTFRTKIIA